ncbi:RHS repeat domain-containing protein, partial [Treponema pedis]|uniref:RHS repeat domain-containing protein n=1 Tax=Treponema pedis TaxID=409322 RepID=UPI0023B807B2
MWNERNLLTKSSDKNYTVHYRYGEDGQRALKYTEEGRSETLYFNNFFTIHIPIYDKDNPQGLRVHKHIFVGNSRLVTAMTHTDNSGDNEEQKEKRYYYHSDHLGSAQFVTDWKGRQYEHIEYTPYGELWIEEVAVGLDKLPFRFTGKELDEETGLYTMGEYLDRILEVAVRDPALNDYIPKAPIDDEAKKHNENLPGWGVFNIVNLHLYHYAGNNPVKYIDPDGENIAFFVNPELAGGNGHTSLYFQDVKGQWNKF